MKLWTKVSAVVVCILVLVVALNTYFTLRQARTTILNLAVENAQTLHRMNQSALEAEALAHRQQVDNAVARRSMLQYLTMRRLTGAVALTHGNEIIFSSIALDTLPALTQDDVNMHVGETHLLLASQATLFMDDAYALYTAHDISAVGKAMRETTIRLLLFGIGCILLGAGLVIWLVRRITRPLSTLAHAARRIAQGQYDERVPTSSHDEVGMLSSDFNAMADAVAHTVSELTAAARRQTLFIGSLTHEMKTPVTAIVGHAETLLFTDMPDTIREDALAQILTQSRWLENLSQKLLQMMVAQRPIERKPVSVADLLDAVQEATRDRLDARSLTLEIEQEAETLSADIDLMASALINLVDNAAKASQPGQVVRLRVDATAIVVADQGSGIAPEHLGNITEPFYMADPSRNKKMGGFGLGLSLVQAIAQAHDVCFSIVSTPGYGTRATIQLDAYK